MSLLSRGNKKLPKTTAIFNLPSVETCPGSTESCRKLCYAKQAEAMYPTVLPARNRNLLASKEAYFVYKIAEELTPLVKRQKIDTVRIHESGDFYSQAYVNKWLTIARIFPTIQFYAHTRSYMFDYSKAPKNIRFIASLDHDSLPAQYDLAKTVGHSAFMGIEVADKISHIVTRGNTVTCPGSCKSCNYCHNTSVHNVSVAFKIHGIHAKGRRVKKGN